MKKAKRFISTIVAAVMMTGASATLLSFAAEDTVKDYEYFSNEAITEENTDIAASVSAADAAEFPTESEVQTDAITSPTTTGSTVSDISVFTEGEIMKLDDVIELSKKGDALALNDLAKFKGDIAGAGIFILEYDLGNGYTFMIGSMTLEKIDFARLCYSSKENYIDIRTEDVEAFISSAPTMIIPSDAEPITTTTSSVPDSKNNDPAGSKDSFSSYEMDDSIHYYSFNTETDNTSPTDLNEYRLFTEAGDDGCGIYLDLASDVFVMSGKATYSFSITGPFERKGDDLYLYPENGTREVYILHREDGHFVSRSEEKGVNLTEGLVFYTDNEEFWEILSDQTPSETGTDNTGDTAAEFNIASDEELAQWAINDYQEKTGITAASAEIRTVSDEEYEIILKDADGNILDTYTIDPETGIGTNSSNEAVDLPQTGNFSTRSLLTAIGAVLMIAFGAAAIVCSGVLGRRKSDER